MSDAKVSDVCRENGTSLSAPVALVTGAAGIIGPAICRELRDAGWRVAATDIHRERFIEHERIYHVPLAADLLIPADLSEREECVRLVSEVNGRLGAIGLLVNNATAHTKAVALADLTRQDCETILRVDMLAPLYLVQAARASLAATQGLVVNISSVRAENIIPGGLLYATAKAALEKMTQAMAIELTADGIRANAIRVGAIPGDAFLRPALALLSAEMAAILHEEVMSEHLADMTGLSLMGRAGRPSDIAEMILYLASSSGRFINGAVLPVDGAFTLRRRAERSPASKGRTVDVQAWASNPAGELEKWLASRSIACEI